LDKLVLPADNPHLQYLEEKLSVTATIGRQIDRKVPFIEKWRVVTKLIFKND